MVEGVEFILGAGSPDLTRRARAHAEREHAWEQVFDRIFAVYEGLLSR